jgi:ketosteroid isomerase-like protein
MGAMHDQELESAFAAYRADVAEMQRTGDWSRYADHFTQDAVYRRHGYADFVGREAIRAFIHTSMTTFPGNQMARFDIIWRIFKEPGRDPTRTAFWHAQNQVVFELRHVMRDPGDGSEHAASTTSMLTYAGGGLWSRCSDLHNLRAYSEMMRGWSRAAQKHGTLDAEATAYLEALTG